MHATDKTGRLVFRAVPSIFNDDMVESYQSAAARGETYLEEWRQIHNRRRPIPLTGQEPSRLLHGNLHRLGSGQCIVFLRRFDPKNESG